MSEVALALLALHRIVARGIDQPADALRHPRDAQFVDHRGDVLGIRFERAGRLIDTDEAASMEKKKREGYF